MTDAPVVFGRIRGEIINAIVATEADLAEKRAAFTLAEANLAKVVGDKAALFEGVEKGVGTIFNPRLGKTTNAILSNSLRQSLFAEIDAAQREAANRVARLRENLKWLVWHLEDQREALAQIELLINPPAPADVASSTVSDEAELVAANGWADIA